MIFENLSREELKAECAKRGVQGYHNLSRSKLVRLLNSLGESETDKQIEEKVQALAAETEDVEEIVETQETVVPESPKETKSKKKEKEQKVEKRITQLSREAVNWRDYLLKINISPAMFLTRYPNHRYRAFIEEIIAFNNQTQVNEGKGAK